MRRGTSCKATWSYWACILSGTPSSLPAGLAKWPLPLGFDVGQHAMCPAHNREALPLGKSECVINVKDGREVDPLLRNAECFITLNKKWQQQEENTSTCDQVTSQSLESNCRAIDWSSERPRRACLAGMVSLVYCAIEKQSVTALKRECNNTGFDLFGDPLEDHGEIYAAIYEYVGVDKSAPDYIFVFRGTSFCRLSTAIYDNKANWGIMWYDPSCCERFISAYEKIEDLVKSLRACSVANFSVGIQVQ